MFRKILSALALSSFLIHTAGIPMLWAAGLPKSILEEEDGGKGREFDLRQWKELRREKETGTFREERITPPPELFEIEPSTIPPPPPIVPPQIGTGIRFEKLESQLAISGRKVIAVNLRRSRFLDKARQAKGGSGTTGFELLQELQVRIRGTVKRKISVNVDFDDTKEDKRDISVIYRGDRKGEVTHRAGDYNPATDGRFEKDVIAEKDEPLQEAAFGDITISLPSSEFVSYSKQVFGARGEAKVGDARFWAIGSRTKGKTEIKRFKGATEFVRQDIADTAFIRRRHYQLAFSTATELPIAQGSEKIFIDDLVTTNNGVNTSTRTYSQFDVATSSSGSFDIIFPGQDYTVDYQKGIITFRNTIAQNAVIAVDYQRADGTFASSGITTPDGTLKLIKSENEGVNFERKNIYTIGRSRIVRDDGKGNFILRILDLSRQTPTQIEGTGGPKPVPIYPEDIEVDFELGTITFKKEKPFTEEAYAQQPTSRYLIFTEYRFRKKIYDIRPGIVLQSERVMMDGRLLTRDVDYFIDYDSGFITFFNEDQIRDTTEIEVTYEFSSFGGVSEETLLGTRAIYKRDVGPMRNWETGSTVLYNFGSSPIGGLPDLRASPSSIVVNEGDTRFTLAPENFPLTTTFSGEVARSLQNPNRAGKALIETMEGIKQADSVSVFRENWVFSSNFDGGKISHLAAGAISITNEAVKNTEINPNADPRQVTDQTVLRVDYNLGSTDQEASIAQPFGKIGLDLSKRLFLETFIHGDGKGEKIILTLGGISEDADGDGALDTEDANKDGILNAGEDTGLNFSDPGPDGIPGNADDTIIKVGSGNGRLDTEDLNADGILKTAADPTGGSFGLGTIPVPALIDSDGKAHTSVDWTGWRLFQIPLGITTLTEKDWVAIKNIRISLRAPLGGASGTLRFASPSVVGNRWEKPVTSAAPASTMTISAINNIENQDYISLLTNADYQELYKDTIEQIVREQALQIRYDLSPNASASTRLTFSKALDFTKHKELRYFIFGDAKGGNLQFQMGQEGVFWAATIPIDFEGWRLITLKLEDVNNDGQPDILTGPANSSIQKSGSPSFASISQIKVALSNPKDSAITSGRIFLNEIHMSDSRKKVGIARRANVDFDLKNWMTFGGKSRSMGRNFQTITTQIANQDSTAYSGYLNLKRLSFLPVSVDVSKSRTVNPALILAADPNLLSIQEEGRVDSFTGNTNASFNWWKLPRLTARYGKGLTFASLLDRFDESDTFTGSADYTLPKMPARILPNILFFVPATVGTSYSISQAVQRFEGAAALAPGRQKNVDLSEDFSGRVSIRPFLNRLTIDPSWNLKRTRGAKQFLVEPLGVEFPKALSQGVGLSVSLRVLRWLQPTASYRFTGTETNDITNIQKGSFHKKTLDRTGNGQISWAFGVRDIASFSPTNSMSFTGGYNIDNGDSYENVSSSFNWLGSLWVRNRLLPFGPDARLKTATNRDTLRGTNQWRPLEFLNLPGPAAPFSTLTTQTGITQSATRAETTATPVLTFDRVWPDLVFSVSALEKMFFAGRFMTGGVVNLKYLKKDTRLRTISLTTSINKSGDWRFNLFKKFDFFATLNFGDSQDVKDELARSLNSRSRSRQWSVQTGYRLGDLRLTPRYENSKSFGEDGKGKTTADLLTRRTSLAITYDISRPLRWRFPLTKKYISISNRLILSNNWSWTRNSSSLNIERDNTDLITSGFSGDYTISDNIRFTLGGSGSRFFNRIKKDEDFYNLEMNTRLTIIF